MDKLKSRKFWLVTGWMALNAGLLISGKLTGGDFVTLQGAIVAAYLLGQSAVDTWGNR